MSQYIIDTEEVAKVISLYSKIDSLEQRIYVQGYLNGLSETTLVGTSHHASSVMQVKPNILTSRQRIGSSSTKG